MNSRPTQHQSHEDKPVLTLIVQHNTDCPALARAAVSAFCETRDIPDDTLATLKLLVSEVVTNAVTHPDLDRPANVRLLARVDQGIIRVEVIDDGSGFDPVAREASQSRSGLGLFLVENEAVRWGVDERGGNRVWFEVALDKHD